MAGEVFAELADGFVQHRMFGALVGCVERQLGRGFTTPDHGQQRGVGGRQVKSTDGRIEAGGENCRARPVFGWRVETEEEEGY